MRKIAVEILTEKYSELFDTGWRPRPEEIQRDVRNLFGGSFERFCRK
jgi:hypothetical protein